jgi:hypothetical protein
VVANHCHHPALKNEVISPQRDGHLGRRTTTIHRCSHSLAIGRTAGVDPLRAFALDLCSAQVTDFAAVATLCESFEICKCIWSIVTPERERSVCMGLIPLRRHMGVCPPQLPLRHRKYAASIARAEL